ncbi:hypothetical protein [Luteolibacter marinus]|uniref:hypothetical protein n=1 Tax=Luteolibacter marinus TaxID=2776705 RepID=UPI0018686AEC|nr:hypothetical protein [Luteolibacter marinus]
MKHLLLPALIATAFCAPVVSARDVNRRVDRIFEKIDINNDNLITRTEFFATQAKRSSLVLALHRFEYADVNQDDVLDLTEFRACKAGKAGGKPSKIREFQLADEDEDNWLDPSEFANTLGQRVPFSKVLKKFAKKDRDDNSLLSPYEYGIRGLR